MFLNPAQVSVTHLQFLAQLGELQDSGYLSETPIDFRETVEEILQEGWRSFSRGPNEATPYAVRLWRPDDFQARLQQFLSRVLRFQPNPAPDFPPLQGLLSRGHWEKRLPVVIEKVSYEEAEAIARFPAARRELGEYAILKEMRSILEPMVFLMRGWHGEVHAMAIAAVTDDLAGKTMLCCRDVKFDRNRRTAFQGVGALFLLSRLLYMRRVGHWSDAAPILRDIRPPVLESYRSHFPPPKAPWIERGEWQVHRAEAEHLLAHSPWSLAEIPLPPSSGSASD